ncbi:hypothetical protein EDC52_103456 [Biostraticola tofi]|uniref:Uncharacterized protein n=2 Tax=Biostraticola tofi TaxID=466109 RepID=A0A4R3Z384_9GAMM|nr:hypothetical protein EDC52_103456 [Biostraticola tofi]
MRILCFNANIELLMMAYAYINALVFSGRRLIVPSLPYALGTGGVIAGYSVTDGVRLSGAPIAYTV